MITQRLNGIGYKGTWVPSTQVRGQKETLGEIFQKSSQNQEPALDARLLQDPTKSESRSGADAAVFLLLMGLGFMAGGAIVGGLLARGLAGALGASPQTTVTLAEWGGGVAGALAGGKVFMDM